MDFDLSKENIQPLRGGRNVTQLEVALQAQSDSELQKELLQQKESFEEAIRTYEGDDPLENWYNYIYWVEQSYPKHGHEGNLVPLLEDCLSKFENEEKYIHDRRLCKLWIKYIDLQQNPLELFQLLHSKGICVSCADLFRAWAYYHEVAGDHKRADAVFELGISALAQPYEDLVLARNNMYTAIGRQAVTGVDERRLVEQRHALTSLRPFIQRRTTMVPNVRTGSQVLNNTPGVLQQILLRNDRASNAPITLYEDQAVAGPSVGGAGASVSILDVARRQEVVHKENALKPGQWNSKKNIISSRVTQHRDSGFKNEQNDVNEEQGGNDSSVLMIETPSLETSDINNEGARENETLKKCENILTESPLNLSIKEEEELMLPNSGDEHDNTTESVQKDTDDKSTTDTGASSDSAKDLASTIIKVKEEDEEGYGNIDEVQVVVDGWKTEDTTSMSETEGESTAPAPEMSKSTPVASDKDSSKNDKDNNNKNGKSNSGRGLWVTNLLTNTRAQELKRLLSQYGEVIGAKIVQSSHYPRTRCYGYVTMETRAAADLCIEKLNNTEFKGERIHLAKEEPEEQRQREREREEEKRRRELQRTREIEKGEREEAMRLEREREKLRVERERLDRQRVEMRLELERDREKLEQQKQHLRRQQMRLEKARRPVKRPSSTSTSNYRRENASYNDDRKRLVTECHYEETSQPPPARFQVSFRYNERGGDRSPVPYRTVRDERERRPVSDHQTRSDIRSSREHRYADNAEGTVKDGTRYRESSSQWHHSNNSPVKSLNGMSESTNSSSRDSWSKADIWRRPVESSSNDRK